MYTRRNKMDIRKNDLTFIEDLPPINGRRYIKCRCECGREKKLRKYLFTSGRQKTCGKCSKIKENLEGRRFGKLVVLRLMPKDERYGWHWECLCDCGGKAEIRSYDLLHGKRKNCKKCTVRINLKGIKFGELVVNKKAYKKDYQVFWECSCVCGNTCIIPTYSLTKGYTKSCGCLKKRCRNNSPLWRGYGEISGRYWNTIKKHAVERGLEFKISIKEAWELFVKQEEKCAISGIEISFPIKSYRNGQGVKTASLDRRDNKKGYIKGNIQWVHKHINIMKRDHTQDYFVELCKAVSSNMK
jgi:hypothetical protein